MIDAPRASSQPDQASWLAAIVESSDNAIISETLDGILTSWNPAAERLYGYSAAEAIGRPITILIPADRLGAEQQILARIGRGEWVERLAAVHLRKTGPPVTVRGTVSPVRDAAGNVVGAAHIARDITDHKQAEAQTRYQAALLSAMKDAVIATDSHLRITAWNPAAEATYGWTAAEVIGRLAAEILQTNIDDHERERLHRATLETGEYHAEVMHRRKDGSPVPIESIVRVLVDDQGAAVGLVAVNRDITVRRQTQELLLASQGRVESILASVADAHSLFDHQWRCTYINKAGVETVGRSREEILGHTLWELYPIIIGTEVERQCRRAMEERLPVNFDFHYLARDTWWESRFFPVPEGLALFATNITERKRAERALAQLAAIVESSDDAIFSKTLEGTILSWNAGAERLYGYSADEAIGRPVSMLIPPERPDELLALMGRLGRGERIQHYETTRLKKDGTRIDVSVTLSPIRDSAGQIVGASAIARDITDRKQAEERIRSAATRTDALLHIARALNAEVDLDRVIQTVCEEARRLMNVPIAVLSLFDKQQEVFRFVGGQGVSPEWAAELRPVPRAHYEKLLTCDEGMIVVPDALAVPSLLNNHFYRALNIRTAVSVTLALDQGPIGILAVSTVGQMRALDEDELELLQGLADIAALAIANAQLFQQVSAARGRLQALSQNLLEMQEAERRLIARQLHDEIGQALTAVKINLQALQRTLGEPGGGQVDDNIAIVEETLQRVRSLSVELRPAMLDDLGLAAALRWYLHRQAQQSGLQERVIADLPDGRLPPQVETACFRVSQEALTNVLRHARATRVEVQLRQDGDALELVIRDDGVGFDVLAAQAQAGRGGSLGLLGMQERVSLVGGDFKVESTPDQGSRVWARFPLKPQAPVERTGAVGLSE